MKHVLFVDDDEDLLNGLRRSLRKKRNEWKLFFSTDPNKALEFMKKVPFDIVISDMRMPSMYGGKFLKIVSETYPNTIRFILTGQADEHTMSQSFKPSHQIIMKPCSSQDIQEKIEIVFDAEKFIPDTELRHKINSLDSLPQIPKIYTILVEALENEKTTFNDIAEIISSDVAITAQILKTVNSSYFGIRKDINSIPEAISFLGMDYIKSMVLTSQLFRNNNTPPNQLTLLNYIHDNSFKIAGLIKLIVKKKNEEKAVATDAFMSAVLQYIGVLIILTLHPNVTFTSESGKHQLQELQALVETPITKVGAYLLVLWGIEPAVVDSVAHYKTPEDSMLETNKVLPYLHIANVVCNGYPINQEYMQTTSLSNSIKAIGLLAEKYLNGEI